MIILVWAIITKMTFWKEVKILTKYLIVFVFFPLTLCFTMIKMRANKFRNIVLK